MTLTEFLLARIAEDEGTARAAAPGPWLHSDANEGVWPPRPGWEVTNDAFHNPPADEDEPWLAVELHTGVEADAEHIARHDPTRVLAECEAKRRIMETCAQYEYEITNTCGYDAVLKALALPYADHPDYREEWKP